MPSAEIVELRPRDPGLEEESRAAVRIVRGIRDGDSSAEAELAERYSRGLGYLLTRRIGDAELARDLLQETFIIAIGKLREIDLDNPERLAGYLRGIAIRVAMNAGRRRRRDPLPTESDVLDRVPASIPLLSTRVSVEQTKGVVRAHLESLSVERDRELLIRYFVYDQDKEQICAELELSSLHFNRVLYRAKERFRDHLRASGLLDDLEI